LGNTKGSYPSNVSTVEKLGNFPPSVPIQNKRIVNMKKLITINNIKRSELEIRKKYTRKRKKNYSKEDSSSYDMSEDDETELKFMGIETQTNNTKENNRNYQVEVQVYLEEEIISALEEMRKYKWKNKSLKE
jgi:hypothetical protein